MKIVLNKIERESFKEFLLQYSKSCVASMENLNVEGADLLEEVRGLSDEELVDKLLADMNRDMGLDMALEYRELEDGSLEVELTTEVLVAYNQFLASSMVAFRPYTVKLAEVMFKHYNTVAELVQKTRGLGISAGIVTRVVKGACTMLGLEGLYSDLASLYNELKNDEETINSIRKDAMELEERVIKAIETK